MKALLAPALLLSSCAMAQSAPPDMGTGTCMADKARGLVGEGARPDLAAKALVLTGARTIRWINPGQPVTMDYSQDRLNIELNEANKVTRFSCG